MRAILPVLALLSGCTTTPPETPPQNASGGTCNADAGTPFIGQTATTALGGQILSATGARTLRWGPPGGAMTMDYREDRVNVFYDDAQVIDRVTCA